MTPADHLAEGLGITLYDPQSGFESHLYLGKDGTIFYVITGTNQGRPNLIFQNPENGVDVFHKTRAYNLGMDNAAKLKIVLLIIVKVLLGAKRVILYTYHPGVAVKPVTKDIQTYDT
jgi:hypothetical protein